MTTPRWPFFPDANQPVVETISFLTDILAGKTHEQRIQMRLTPKRTFEFRLVEMKNPESAALFWQIEQGVEFEAIVPFWPEHVLLEQDYPAGSASLNTTRSAERFAIPGFAMLWRSESEYEFVDVVGIGVGPGPIGNLLLAGGGTTMDWEKDRCWVVPCFQCKLLNDPLVERPGPSVVVIPSLTFEAIPGL